MNSLLELLNLPNEAPSCPRAWPPLKSVQTVNHIPIHSNPPMTPMMRSNSPSLRSQRQSPLAVPAKKTDQMSSQDQSANCYPSHPSERMPQNHNDTNIPKNRPVIPPPFTPQRSQKSRNDTIVPTSHRQSYENHNTKPISTHDDAAIPTSC